MNAPLNLEQLRKQAKELANERRAEGVPAKLSDAQLELARRHGFASWPRLKQYVERLVAAERECCPFLGLELTIRDESVTLVTAFPQGLSPNDWEW